MEAVYGEYKVIARIHNDYASKFGIPRQSGIVNEAESVIIFEKPYCSDDAVRGLDAYNYVWLLWIFSDDIGKKWSPTVRPPKLGGNVRKGVFATRSPMRPNPIGLSSVKILSINASGKNILAIVLIALLVLALIPVLPYVLSLIVFIVSLPVRFVSGIVSVFKSFKRKREERKNFHRKE